MTTPSSRFHPRRVLDAVSDRETSFIADALRQETIGGAILLVTATVAVVWANSPWRDAYDEFIHVEVGPLSIEHWAADGGLALFFYIAGLELKRELTVGSLRRPADALVPVAAAVGGMLVPAVIYLVVNVNGSPEGWAVPTATDIAFALAVLAIVGRALPTALRAFLLTLAVVDDLGAILVIASVYTEELDLLALSGAAALLGVFWLLQHRRVSSWVIYLPLAVATWSLVYLSGVHATIAGVALGLLTRCAPDEDEVSSPAERLEHRLRPLSAGVAVPLFALVSAGVAINVGSDLLREPVVMGIVLGLVVGKTIGVFGGAWLVTRLTRAELAEGIYWRDVVGVATVSGVGFTVSLLIADLAFDGEQVIMAKTAVLAGSLLAGLVAAVVLHRRHKHHESQQTA
jgi:Na+:H+ antiporter, NhaA family